MFEISTQNFKISKNIIYEICEINAVYKRVDRTGRPGCSKLVYSRRVDITVRGLAYLPGSLPVEVIGDNCSGSDITSSRSWKCYHFQKLEVISLPAKSSWK